MAKRGRPRKSESSEKGSKGRVVHFGKGGNLPQGSTEVAPAHAETAEPSPVLIPTGEEAELALKDIADLNRRVQRAHAQYQNAAAVAKEWRDTWQGLAEQLQTLIAVKTTKPDMPLFDAGQREADHQGMLQSAEAPSVALPPDGSETVAPETQALQTEGETVSGGGSDDIEAPAPSDATQELLQDDEIPF